MFFYISKLAYFFISPVNWIMILLVWRYFSKSTVIRKRLMILIIVLVLIFGNEVLYVKLVTAWQPKPVLLEKLDVYEAGILLGGAGSFDKHGTGFLNQASDRLIGAAILYKAGKIKRIIISGGAVYDDRPKEAPFLNRKLLELGIPQKDIIIETESRTTFENAIYTKRIIDSIGLKGPFVLITSASHIPRARQSFERAQLPVIPYPTNYTVLDKKFDFADYVVPGINTLFSWSGFMKELVGLWGYKLFKKA